MEPFDFKNVLRARAKSFQISILNYFYLIRHESALGTGDGGTL